MDTERMLELVNRIIKASTEDEIAGIKADAIELGISPEVEFVFDLDDTEEEHDFHAFLIHLLTSGTSGKGLVAMLQGVNSKSRVVWFRDDKHKFVDLVNNEMALHTLRYRIIGRHIGVRVD